MRMLTLTLFLTSLIACKDNGGDDTGGGSDTGSGLTGDVTAGETVYSDVCAACHGTDGMGIEGYSPSMFDEFADLSDAEITGVIKNGLGEMPAQTQLSDQDIADVIAYGRATFIQ